MSVFLVIPDKATDDNHYGAGDKDIIGIRLYFHEAQHCSRQENDHADDQYDSRFSHKTLFFFHKINIFPLLVHEIMFACVALEAVGLLQHLDLALRPVGTLNIAVALLLKMTDFASALGKPDQTLLSHKEINDQKDQKRNDIFRPYLPFAMCYPFGEFHTSRDCFLKIDCKVTIFFGCMQIFL